jgi:hypothetical protein
MASPKNTLHSTIDISISQGADFEITDTKIIVYNVPLTGEIVQQYEDGFAFKPADEITKIIVKGVDVTFLHVGTVNTMPTLEFAKNAQGSLREPSLDRKDNVDDKKLYADIVIFRTADTVHLEQALNDGKGIDVSIGFSYMLDPTPGVFNGVSYDYVQRNIILDHLAVLMDQHGTVYPGRAPFPFYGIGADSKNNYIKMVGEKTVSEDLYNKSIDQNTTLTSDNAKLKISNDELSTKVSELETTSTDANDKLTKANDELVAANKKLEDADAELKDFRQAKVDAKATKVTELKEKYPAMDTMFDTASDDAIDKAHKELQDAKQKNINADGGNGTGAKTSDSKETLEKQGFNKPFKETN